MKQFELKYGCNPNQKPARIYMADGSDLPVEILNGRPGYINFLDAFNAWQLVKELKESTGFVAATSFKHVSPTSAAIGKKLPPDLKKSCFADDIEGLDDSPLACAYARARGTDRMSSFGDFIALSDECDEVTAKLIAREVSDGIIAPAYSPKALEILKGKRKGAYNIIRIDPSYTPAEIERKQVFGVTFEQGRNKYTQSNSVCFATDGQAIGVGAGQQSRIHCTRLAAQKADLWHLRRHEKVLSLQFAEGVGRPEKNNIIDLYLSDTPEEVTGEDVWRKNFAVRPEPFSREEKAAYLKTVTGVSVGSDAFFPFADNIERAHQSGVTYVAEPGGSVRDDLVIAAADKHNMVMCFTGMRLFHH